MFNIILLNKLSSLSNIDVIWMRNHSKTVSKILRIRLGKVFRVLELEVLDECGGEYEEAVPGECLAHTNPPPDAEGYKLFLLLQLESRLSSLEEPLGSEGFRLWPDLRVLLTVVSILCSERRYHLHEAPETRHGKTILRDDIVSDLDTPGDPAGEVWEREGDGEVTCEEWSEEQHTPASGPRR